MNLVDSEGFEPILSSLYCDMTKTNREQSYLSFYFSNNTFDGVPTSMTNYPKYIAIFGKNWVEIIGIAHEDCNIIELITPV